MAHVSLSRRDFNVLEKIKDPESDPAAAVLVDASLPKDPHVQDPLAYEQAATRERKIVASIQDVEMQLAGLRPKTTEDICGEYLKQIAELDDLISTFPNYASARNNRAQALRRMYGEAVMFGGGVSNPRALFKGVEEQERIGAAEKMMGDLDHAIALLTPSMPYAAVSPQAANTLSMAYTQRAALYHLTSKLLPGSTLAVSPHRRESSWNKLHFEENASRDFAMGGRYGNEIAKALAVGTNPTAKLCGQMVREAMEKEYGAEFGA